MGNPDRMADNRKHGDGVLEMCPRVSYHYLIALDAMGRV
jgi:hypothetical protein